MNVSPLEFLSDLSALSLQLFVHYSSVFSSTDSPVVSTGESLLQEAMMSVFALSASPVLEGSSLPCDLPSLTHPRRAVDFSVCLDFYLFLGWSSIF